MIKKVKVGFVGAGTVGQMHIDHWAKLADCEMVALADLRPQLRNLVADQFAIPKSYNSHHELIRDEDIEAVVVVTRRHNTAAVVADCLKAGKHVFSEKPMAMTAEQACQLAQTANKLNLAYAVGYQRRHDAGTQIAKEAFDRIVKSGELGKVTLVRCWNFTGQDRSPDSSWLMTPEQRPEGVKWSLAPEWLPAPYHNMYDRFVNVCCHDINIQRYFFGQTPTVKFANLDHKEGWAVVFDFSEFLSLFSGGFNELNDGGQPGQWDEGLEVIFEKGRLCLRFSPPLVHNLCSRVELEKTNQEKEILCSGSNQMAAFTLQAQYFLKDVLQKRTPLTSGEDAVADLQIIEDIWKNYLHLDISH